jgi:hypothetical protein
VLFIILVFCVALFCLSSFCVLCPVVSVCLDHPFLIAPYNFYFDFICDRWPSVLFNIQMLVKRNRISGVIVGVLDYRTRVDRVKLKTIKKIFVASPQSTQQNVLVIYIYKTQIDVQSSNRSPLTSLSQIKVRFKVIHIYGVDVVEWSRALDVRLSEWCCSVSMEWVQIPSREEQKFDSSKNLILTLFGLIFRRIYILYIYIYIYLI